MVEGGAMPYEMACHVHVYLKGLIMEMLTSDFVTSRHVQLLRALQEGTGWRDERCSSADTKTVRWAAFLGAHLVAVARLTKQGRWDLGSRFVRMRERDAVGFGDAARLQI
jgi:hypothetical protein